MVTYHVSCTYNNFIPHRLSFNSINMEITVAAARPWRIMLEHNSRVDGYTGITNSCLEQERSDFVGAFSLCVIEQLELG